MENADDPARAEYVNAAFARVRDRIRNATREELASMIPILETCQDQLDACVMEVNSDFGYRTAAEYEAFFQEIRDRIASMS